MREVNIKKWMAPTGPLLSISLIGLLLLSALLYYRSIKIQRFLEPALAISDPRIKFNNDINNLIEREFGTAFRGVQFRSRSIYVDQSLLFASAHGPAGAGPIVFRKLGNVFLSALNDRAIRNRISLILVSTTIPLTSDSKINKAMRFKALERTGLILNGLFGAVPELEKKYGIYFAVTTIHKIAPIQEADMIEFQLIPTEQLHIDVLERLEHYAE